MMRISLDSPALAAVRSLLGGLAGQPTPRAGRGRGSKASRTRFSAERLEPRMMLDAGMRALLPDLAEASDTGASNADNLTFDRTPVLTGIVRGAASQVRLFIDGRPAAVVPVVNGTWTHEVPAEAALAAGKHRIAVRPIDASARAGKLSRPLNVTVVTAVPAAPTRIGLAAASDSGAKGDGRTIVSAPTLRGVAQPGRHVSVSIDGVFAGRVRSDARTGVWSLKAPRLASGVHDVTAVTVNRAGLQSVPTSFEVEVNGVRTVMLDAANGQTVELMASHLLGGNSQGFAVTQVHRGILQKWSVGRNAWVTIPRAGLATNPATLQNPPAIRRLAFNDLLRWTPGRGDVGMAPAFDVIPLDKAGALTAPTPEAGTVPGRVTNAELVPVQEGIGSTITWEPPTDGDGCGCPSTRYSIEVTRGNGRTLLYNVPSSVRAIPIVEGGDVLNARIWGATKTGAGAARTYDTATVAGFVNRFNYTVVSAASFTSLGQEARAQVAASLTGVGHTTSLPLGASHANLAYLEIQALPDDVEAAQGVPAGTPMIVTSDSNRLSPAQRGDLEANPIYARHLFPGTVAGQVQPDQVRLHFQAGETLRFAGNVDASIRNRATIVVEEAAILGDGSLGHWYPKVRIAVGADGGYSYDHAVPYGMMSVRVRLEVDNRVAPASVLTAGTSSVATSSAPSATHITSTPIWLDFNAFGITTPPWQAPNSQGFDRNGNYYNSDYTGSGTDDPIPGTPIQFHGIEFPIGPIPTKDTQVGGSGNSPTKNPPNFVQAKGQTITVSVDADSSDYLYLAGAASNGDQLSQKITLTFTDGSTETWTQSFTDWGNNGSSGIPRPYSGELLLKTQPERINQQGNLVTTPAYIFSYGYNLKGKQLASITLPDNENVGILSAVVAKAPLVAIDEGVEYFVLGTANLTGIDLMALTIKNESNIGAGGGPLTFFFADQPVQGSVATPSQPATYTTKQVTVPMGQQQMIAYIAPDSTSQMTFYVQKGDDTCVGPNCSTYLTDWKDGSGSSDFFAANINPSLNTQMKAGQHWTMTIQNAGLGYYGYLDSPSGQGLPSGHGSTPAGAQFKLMTQAEIDTQPPWAVAIEEALGATVALIGLTVLTAGAADAAIIADVVVDGVVDAGVDAGTDALAVSVTADAGDGSFVAEEVLTDSWVDVGAEDIDDTIEEIDPDLPVIEEVDQVPVPDTWRPDEERLLQQRQAAQVARVFNQFF